ncbi:hypothetical protein [Magnetofaba australis]|uniref:hypothetical protein n=1 Tax=Magnetofaba australis TaxID=1472297 RepID=UPI000A19E418|nr:hypothetical protein [Magnetofaba australis]
MFRPRTSQEAGGVAQFASIPAPIKGWNARDSIIAMSPEHAIELINFIPRPGRLELRRGFVSM